MDNDDRKEYRWEEGYEKTWEAIREDEDGFLDSAYQDSVRRAQRRKVLEQHAVIRLGVMRHLFVILDLSECMSDQDLKPTRQICAVKLMEKFVDEFMDQNPISQLGLIATSKKRAEKINDLSGNPLVLKAALKKMLDIKCSDEPSLFNALDLASQTLKNMPSHTSREVLVILGSLTTCDPGDIHNTLKSLKTHNIRCSVIGLAAELHICKLLSKETGGSYNVILDDSHFQDLLLAHIIPPPAAAASASSLIRMGFPHRRSDRDLDGVPSLCMCHLDSKSGSSSGVSVNGYFCPQCQCKYCELPVECKACGNTPEFIFSAELGLTLVSAPHLARSYHYFFRIDPFQELKDADSTLSDSHEFCAGCQKPIENQAIYRCPKCFWHFCYDCDMFLHETLHTCPGCASTPSVIQKDFRLS